MTPPKEIWRGCFDFPQLGISQTDVTHVHRIVRCERTEKRQIIPEIINNPSNVNDETLFEESYNRVLPELQALSSDELASINLEVNTAVSTILGAMPEIRAQRDNVAKQLPDHDVTQFDKVEDYAMALSYANTQYCIATQPPDDLQALLAEGIGIRETLCADLATLIRRGFISEESLKDLKGPNGYKNVANDLQITASLLKNNWSQIEGKCAVQQTEIEHALKLAAHILRVVGLREQSPVTVAAAADMRVRAFTLFTRAYDNVRRAIIYLRWHEGDADSIAPSLYVGRSNGKKKPATDDKPNAPTPAPVTTSGGATPPVVAPATPTPGATNGAKPAVTSGPNNGSFMQ